MSIETRLDAIVAKAKTCDLVPAWKGDSSDFARVDMALPRSVTMSIWTDDGKRSNYDGWGNTWEDVDKVLKEIRIDVSTIAGFAIDADGITKEYHLMRKWTGCRFMLIDSTRCWALNVYCLPPNLRILDLSQASTNLGSVDFKLLDEACPNLELLLLENAWSEDQNGQHHYEALAQNNFDIDGVELPCPLDNCLSVDYLNTSQRSYGVFWVSYGNACAEEYWPPHEGRHPLYFPQWRTCVNPRGNNTEWIVEHILENVPDIDARE